MDWRGIEVQDDLQQIAIFTSILNSPLKTTCSSIIQSIINATYHHYNQSWIRLKNVSNNQVYVQSSNTFNHQYNRSSMQSIIRWNIFRPDFVHSSNFPMNEDPTSADKNAKKLHQLEDPMFAAMQEKRSCIQFKNRIKIKSLKTNGWCFHQSKLTKN